MMVAEHGVLLCVKIWPHCATAAAMLLRKPAKGKAHSDDSACPDAACCARIFSMMMSASERCACPAAPGACRMKSKMLWEKSSHERMTCRR